MTGLFLENKLNNVEFYDAPDIKRLAEKLIERYYVYIGHADIDNIHFARLMESSQNLLQSVQWME